MDRHRLACAVFPFLFGLGTLLLSACSDSSDSEPSPDLDGDASLDGDLDWERPASEDREWIEAEEAEEELFVPPPWNAPEGPWSTCPDVTPERSLSETAVFYDWIVPAIHQVPEDDSHYQGFGLVQAVEQCAWAVPTNVMPERTSIPKCRFSQDDRAAQWTSLYVASQAYRLAVTGEEEARKQLRKGLQTLAVLSRLGGVEGVQARQFIQPHFFQEECPSDDESYQIPDETMKTRSWVKVAEDGELLIFDPAENDGVGAFVSHEDYTTDTSFQDFCFQRNPDKKDYAAVLFALGVTAHVAPEPEFIVLAKEIALAIGKRIVEQEFAIVDYDGRETDAGGLFSQAPDSPSGFNALLALSFLKTAAMISEDPGLTAIYEDCLLQERGRNECIDRVGEQPKSYATYLSQMGLKQGCSTDYEQVGTALLAYQNLIWWETDAERRATIRQAFHGQTGGQDIDFRDLWTQKNVMLNFIVTAMMENPDEALRPQAETMIEDAVCMLKRFPTDYRQTRHDNSTLEVACISELYGPLTTETVSVADHCPSPFVWWRDPAEIEACQENLKAAYPPTGFLLPYWMGRYFGFIPEDM